jgi:hypothetical protein
MQNFMLLRGFHFGFYYLFLFLFIILLFLHIIGNAVAT